MKNYFIILYIACIAMTGMFVSCEVDNYEGPDGTLTGNVIDAVTGNPILTEQPNGFRIRYKEISWSETATDQYLWGKPDGTFNHTKLFAGTYEITAVEGAFVTPATQQVEIKSGGVTTATFTVTPYVSFSNVSIVKEGATSVKATFTINRNVPEAAPQDYRIFASSKTPYVGTNSGGSESDVSLSATPFTEADLGTPIVVTLNNYVAGKTYYIRIGARCTNSSSRYNMTEVFEIQM
jgi:hypothetical protein